MSEYTSLTSEESETYIKRKIALRKESENQKMRDIPTHIRLAG